MKDGLLKDIGVNVGFGLGVNAVKDNDPVRVATNVGVSLGESGRAGGIPYFFPGQGEEYSLNDYDGNKQNIVPDRAKKYYIEQVRLFRRQQAIAAARERESLPTLREDPFRRRF